MSDVIEVATGGDPVGALARWLREDGRSLLWPGALNHLSIAHDEGCPSERRLVGLPGCTCEIIEISVKPEEL